MDVRTGSISPVDLYSYLGTATAPVLIDGLTLDMYEHSYHIDSGAKPVTYVETHMKAIKWATPAVTSRRSYRARRDIAQVRTEMKTIAVAALALIGWLSAPAASNAADSCKKCQEFLKACPQAHSKAACQTDYNICKKHCKDK